MIDVAVSVIMACHDAERTLASTLRRLAASEFTNFEIIVVDDASNDASREVARRELESFAAADLIGLDHNVGVAEARNVALSQARGDYVWFIDADDDMPPTALRDLHTAAVEHDADIVFARATESDSSLDRVIPIDGLDIEEAVELSVDDVFASMARGEIRGFLWSKLFRRSVLPPSLFPSLRSQSDFMGLVRALENSRTFVAIPAFVYDYVRAAGSITTRRDSFAPLLMCERAFLQAATARGANLSNADQAYFSGGLTLLAGLDSALRTGSWGTLDKRLVRREFRRLSPGGVIQVMRSHRGIGGRIALARVSLTGYAIVYRLGRAARGAATAQRSDAAA